jgi:hypothetical protein
MEKYKNIPNHQPDSFRANYSWLQGGPQLFVVFCGHLNN